MFGLGRLLAAAKAFSTSSQTRPSSGQGPFTSSFASYLPRTVEGSFYELLREAVPYLDLAINRLTALDGFIEIIGDNAQLVDEIKDWAYNVPVNDVERGLQAFHRSLTSEAFEQGFAIGEFVADAKRKSIAGLYTADSKLIKFKRTKKGYDVYLRKEGASSLNEKPLNPESLMYFGHQNENQDPYGVSLFRGLEFTSKVFATIQNATLNNFERWGEPAFHAHYKGARMKQEALDKAVESIKSNLSTAARDKREGKSVDIVTASQSDGDVVIKVLGSDGQVLEIQEPLRAVVEQFVSKSGLPPWMFGIQWATTQNMGDGQAEVVLAEVRIRQAAKGPLFWNLIRTELALRGRTWKPGDWGIRWAQVNLHDVEKQAKAAFLNSQAEMMLSGAPPRETDEGKVVTLRHSKSPRRNEGSCTCGLDGCKELHRTVAWPELDRIEDGYEDRLKADWQGLEERITEILALSEPKAAQKDSPLPGDIPSLGEFTFSEEQRARIMAALKNHIGAYRFDAEDSPVRYYYGRAYSAGLLQAAQMLGNDRPVLDIIRNREDFERLAREGFDMVKDRATLHIRERIIPEMEAQAIAGTNPRHVGARLKKLFGQANSDWERLARTEMSVSAEKAKVAEWKENGVRGTERAVIAGRDTHPRCRCANTIEHDENGKAYVVFSPAPDACEICMAAAV